MNGLLPRLLPWLGELVLWARLPGSILLSLAGGLLLVLLWPDEAVIRWCGLLFEVLGIGSLAVSVVQTREHFGLPGIRDSAGRWLRSRPTLKRHIRVALGSGKITVTGAFGAGRVRRRFGPDATVDQRLEALEADVDTLASELTTTRRDLEQKDREQADKLEQERQLREQSDDAIRRSMEAHETGGLRLTVLGLCWFLLGAVMGTGAPELASFGQWLSAEPYPAGVTELLWMFLAGHASPAFPC